VALAVFFDYRLLFTLPGIGGGKKIKSCSCKNNLLIKSAASVYHPIFLTLYRSWNFALNKILHSKIKIEPY